MKTAVIYCRVSTEDQEREGTSLDSQREACLKKAHELGYKTNESHILREVYSGLSLERPKLDELREWIKSKEIEAVIVYSTDRLSRDPLHLLFMAEECEKAKVNLCFVTEPLDNSMEGQLLGFVRGWASKLEAIRMRERSLRGRRMRINEGRLVCGKGVKLFGYDYDQEQGIRRINEFESQLVKSIFAWYVSDGLSLSGIANRLGSLGIPSPAGNRYWSNATLHNILTNKAYIGKTFAFTRTHVEAREHRKAERKHKLTTTVFKPESEWIEIPNSPTPAIIDEELFNQAQVRLKRNRELASRNLKREYLLRGFVYGVCGRRFTGATRLYKTKSGIKLYRYYRENPPTCHRHRWNANKLERLVWEEVEKVLSNPEVVLAGLKALQAGQDNSLEQQLAQVNDRLKELDRQQGQLLQWALKGFPEDTVIIENKRINQDRSELTKQRDSLERLIQTARQAELDTLSIKKACELVSDNLTDLSLENQRLALEALNVRVWLDDEGISIEGAIPRVYGVIATSSD